MLGSLSFHQRLLKRSEFILPTGDRERITKTGSAKIYLCNDVIVKVSRNHLDSSGQVGAPFRAEMAQTLIQHLLSEYVCRISASPHVCMSLGEPQITKKHITSYMEHALEGDLAAYLKQLSRYSVNLDEYFRVSVFQVAYTLAAIYAVMPNFRHNDLKPTNVFVSHTLTSKRAVTKYTMADGVTTFTVPNDLGINTLLADFDFSCCAGIADNYKVIEFWGMYPHLSIGWRRNHATDLAYFVKTLYALIRPRLSSSMCKTIERIYTPTYLSMFTDTTPCKNYMRNFPSDNTNIPTVYDVLLKSELFTTYRTTETRNTLPTIHHYRIKTVDSVKWPQWALRAAKQYKRVVLPFNNNTNMGYAMHIFKNVMLSPRHKIRKRNERNVVNLHRLYNTLVSRKYLNIRAEFVKNHIVAVASKLFTQNTHCVIFALCCLLDGMIACGEYTLETANPAPEDWSSIFNDNNYNTEQILQIMLQYTWVQQQQQ